MTEPTTSSTWHCGWRASNHGSTSHEPVPFIVDDILLNFDDDRSTAALAALAELSRKTQVFSSPTTITWSSWHAASFLGILSSRMS